MMPCKNGGYGFEIFHSIRMRDTRKSGTQAILSAENQRNWSSETAARQFVKKTQGPNVVDET